MKVYGVAEWTERQNILFTVGGLRLSNRPTRRNNTLWNLTQKIHTILNDIVPKYPYRTCLTLRSAYLPSAPYGPNWNLDFAVVENSTTILGMTPIRVSRITHLGRVTHICVNKLTIIGSDNGLSPGRRQAIIWTNAGILLIGPLGTNFSEILFEIFTFSFKKMHVKMSSVKWRPSFLGLNVITGPAMHNITCIFLVAPGQLYEPWITK